MVWVFFVSKTKLLSTWQKGGRLIHFKIHVFISEITWGPTFLTSASQAGYLQELFSLSEEIEHRYCHRVGQQLNAIFEIQHLKPPNKIWLIFEVQAMTYFNYLSCCKEIAIIYLRTTASPQHWVNFLRIHKVFKMQKYKNIRSLYCLSRK